MLVELYFHFSSNIAKNIWQRQTCLKSFCYVIKLLLNVFSIKKCLNIQVSYLVIDHTVDNMCHFLTRTCLRTKLDMKRRYTLILVLSVIESFLLKHFSFNQFEQ